jgi:hypothetical protein
MHEAPMLKATVRRRCVGSLNDEPVYFIGSRTSFYLAVEFSPGRFRRLSDTEHMQFKRQSRIEGIYYRQ